MASVERISSAAAAFMLAEFRPERAEPAAVRWHGRLELESSVLTLAESQLALAALASVAAAIVKRSRFCAGFYGAFARR